MGRTARTDECLTILRSSMTLDLLMQRSDVTMPIVTSLEMLETENTDEVVNVEPEQPSSFRKCTPQCITSKTQTSGLNTATQIVSSLSMFAPEPLPEPDPDSFHTLLSCTRAAIKDEMQGTFQVGLQR